MSVLDDVPVKRRNNRKWLIKRVDIFCLPACLANSLRRRCRQKMGHKSWFCYWFSISGLESSRHAHWCTCSYIIPSQKWCHLSTAERSIQWRYFIIAHTQRKEVLKCHSTLVACLTLFYTLQINRHVHWRVEERLVKWVDMKLAGRQHNSAIVYRHALAQPAWYDEVSPWPVVHEKACCIFFTLIGLWPSQLCHCCVGDWFRQHKGMSK